MKKKQILVYFWFIVNQYAKVFDPIESLSRQYANKNLETFSNVTLFVVEEQKY